MMMGAAKSSVGRVRINDIDLSLSILCTIARRDETLSNGEIAEVCGCSQSLISQTARNAIAKLQGKAGLKLRDFDDHPNAYHAVELNDMVNNKESTMKLDFDLLTRLIAFCETERTVTEMKNRTAFDYDPVVVQSTINFMMKQKLIVMQPNFSRGGRTQPNTWVKNISLTSYATKKAG